MPTLERDDVVSSLCKKGFTEQTGGDHRYFRLMHDGKDTGIYTMTSRGGKKYRTLGNDLVSRMAKQLKLPTKAFVTLGPDPRGMKRKALNRQDAKIWILFLRAALGALTKILGGLGGLAV